MSNKNFTKYQIVSHSYSLTKVLNCAYTLLLCPQVDNLDNQQRMELGEKLLMHCKGPMVLVVQYNRYVVNRKLFCTIAYDVGRRSQNSSVCVSTVDDEMYYES